ncbi:MAG: hypothetical protein Q9168_002366 [Polycauliona sp. 1 TL-2023]
MPPKRTRKSTTGPKKKQKIVEAEEPYEEEHIQPTAAELEVTTSVDDADGFSSQIFTILAGEQQQKFTAHASFLSQSPVLERMCHGHFQESRTFIISLPDDKPGVIRALIQYFYTGDIQKFGSVDPAGCTTTALRSLAELYGAAEKYQMRELKTLIIIILQGLIDLVNRPIEFVDAAKEIYDYISDSDKGFRNFFINGCVKLPLPKAMNTMLRQKFDDHLAEGGEMALDMVIALCTNYELRIEAMNATEQVSLARFRKEKREISDERATYKKACETWQRSYEWYKSNYEELLKGNQDRLKKR